MPLILARVDETDFAFWRRSLGGERVETHEDDPQLGYYRKRFQKDGDWRPVQVYAVQPVDDANEPTDDRKIIAVAYIGGEKRSVDLARDWVWLAKHPISYGDFCLMRDGKPGPDGMIPFSVPEDINKTELAI